MKTWSETEYEELKEGDEIRAYGREARAHIGKLTSIMGGTCHYIPGIIARKNDTTLVIKQGPKRFVEVTRDCIFERYNDENVE